MHFSNRRFFKISNLSFIFVLFLTANWTFPADGASRGRLDEDGILISFAPGRQPLIFDAESAQVACPPGTHLADRDELLKFFTENGAVGFVKDYDECSKRTEEWCARYFDYWVAPHDFFIPEGFDNNRLKGVLKDPSTWRYQGNPRSFISSRRVMTRERTESNVMVEGVWTISKWGISAWELDDRFKYGFVKCEGSVDKSVAAVPPEIYQSKRTFRGLQWAKQKPDISYGPVPLGEGDFLWATEPLDSSFCAPAHSCFDFIVAKVDGSEARVFSFFANGPENEETDPWNNLMNIKSLTVNGDKITMVRKNKWKCREAQLNLKTFELISELNCPSNKK